MIFLLLAYSSLFLASGIDGFVPPTAFGRSAPHFVSTGGVDICGIDGPADVCFAFDYDGTLVDVGEVLRPKDEEVLRGLKDIGLQIFVITAQSAAYMRESVDPSIFAGIICECNVDIINPDGKVLELMDLESMSPAQERIENFIVEMNWNFKVNRKRAGFAVDVRGATKHQEKAIVDEVKGMAFENGMRCAPTAGFVDYMLPESVQNKALGLKALKKRLPLYKFITGGDSINTDGPMLEISDSSYIVGGDSFKSAKKVSRPAVTMKLLALLEHLCRNMIEE